MRTSLLVLLGIVLAIAAVFSLRNSAGPEPPTSNPSRPQQQAAAGEKFDPKQLDVKVERLKETLPSPDDTERNPFRFQPKPQPPPPKPPPERDPLPRVVDAEPFVPEKPPIPLKFIGVIEAPGVGKVAALTDCRRTIQGVEGQEIEGRYRIVTIGVESLVIEHLDGTGRMTLRKSGQECVAK